MDADIVNLWGNLDGMATVMVDAQVKSKPCGMIWVCKSCCGMCAADRGGGGAKAWRETSSIGGD